jgi:hypothetical protein
MTALESRTLDSLYDRSVQWRERLAAKRFVVTPDTASMERALGMR